MVCDHLWANLLTAFGDVHPPVLFERLALGAIPSNTQFHRLAAATFVYHSLKSDNDFKPLSSFANNRIQQQAKTFMLLHCGKFRAGAQPAAP